MYGQEYIGTIRGGKAAIILLLSLSIVLFLSGCKYTDVLTEHIEDPDIGVLDESIEPIYQENPNAPFDPNRMNRTVSDAPDEDTQVESLPHYDPDALDNGPTKRLVHKEETPHNEQAAEGTQESGSSNSSQGQGNDSGSDTGTGDDLTSDEANAQGNQSQDAGAGGMTVIVDDQGTNSDRSAKGTVAAVGEYATITQMLGGAGSLVAADQHWFDSLPSGVFPDELGTVQVAWSGDGTEYGQTNVDALINDIHPAVILWDGSSPALTADERSQLEEAGITVQAVPTLGKPETEDANVRQAIMEVAAILADVATTDYDAVAMRDAYLSYHEQVLRACYHVNGDAYSCKAIDATNPHLYQNSPLAGFDNNTNTRTTITYVDSWWFPGVSYTNMTQQATTGEGLSTKVIALPHDGQSLDVADGVGLSVASSADNYMILDYYLQFSGIVNNAYDTNKPTPEGKPYLLVAGRASDIGLGGAFQARTGVDSALWYNSGSAIVAANWKVLGDADFPALFVNGEASEDIAAHIVASAAKSDGLYNMQNQYQVCVIPSGVSGNWAYGNVESFLVAPWALRVRDANASSSAADLVRDFYKYFYRCDDWSSAVRNWSSVYTAD